MIAHVSHFEAGHIDDHEILINTLVQDPTGALEVDPYLIDTLHDIDIQLAPCVRSDYAIGRQKVPSLKPLQGVFEGLIEESFCRRRYRIITARGQALT
jgi:hypothetical protein